MEKKQRNILIAVVAGACVLIICVIVGRILLVGGMTGVLMNMAGINGENFGSTQETKITELNQPYENNGLKITAMDVKAIDFSDADNQVIVGIKLEFENVSKKDRYINGLHVTAYVDGISALESVDSISPEENIVYGDLAPGRRTAGYYCVKAPKDAKQIELNYKDDTFSKVNVTFVFDIPPVEE